MRHVALWRVKRLLYSVKWQRVAKAFLPHRVPEKETLYFLCGIFFNVFSEKCTQRRFPWHGRQGETVWGPERVESRMYVWGLTRQKLLLQLPMCLVSLVKGDINAKIQSNPKRTVLPIISPLCSRCYLSHSTGGCLHSSPQAPEEPTGRGLHLLCHLQELQHRDLPN